MNSFFKRFNFRGPALCAELRKHESLAALPVGRGLGRIATALAVVLFIWPGNTQAQVVGTVGDVGSITVPVANNTLSFAADSVLVTASAPPGLDFQILSTSQLGPSSVAPGTTNVFLISYQIGPNAQSGSYTLQIHPTYAGALTYLQPPGTTLDTTVNFPIRAVEFLDVAALRAVSNQACVFGLKLASDRLHGIEGREQAFASYSGVGQGAEPSAGVSAAIGCGGPIWTSEKVGPRVEARKVMSPERIGERPLASALRIRTCGLPVNSECPSRIQTWESVWIAVRFAGSSGRSTNAVGSLALASPSRIHQVERRAVGALAFPLHHGAKRRDVSRQAGSRRAVGARAYDVAEARCSEDFLCRICVAPEGSRLVVTAGKKCRGVYNG